MGLIRVLPPPLVSRIAAGECVERPASVVKELVENALDAGAEQVDIAIEDGGRALIEVVDDGRGMDADDLRLSVTQHATSKIRTDDDLFNIHTLGFRGEALASIGAVSRLHIVSRPVEQEVAHELTVEAGELKGPRPCAAPSGTTIRVRDLFYAVPARRKFLRTNQTETGHITEQLARIALAQPSVGFTLKSNQRTIHRLEPTSNARQRIADFYGPELAQVLIPVHREGGGVQVDGLVAPPAESRGSSKWEYVFVNGRYVRDRFVSHAIKEAYRSLIDPSRYPVVFLFITIEPEMIDVNVHPTKIEVRWRDSNYVHGQVLAMLREKFLSTRLDHVLETKSSEPGKEEYRTRVRDAMVDFFTRTRPTESTNQPSPHAHSSRTIPPVVDADRETPPPAETPAAEPSAAHRYASFETNEGAAPGDEAGPGRAIQVHNAYLVVETDEGLMIVDQHALHERILYEDLRRRVTQGHLESQRLLMPQVVRVPADRLEALETHADTLARLGVELTIAGPQSVALQAFPTLLQDRVDPERFVRDLFDLLAEQGTRPDTESLVHDILDMMACKAAVKAGDPLTPEEIQALLERRSIADRTSHCPHGRPTTLQLTLRDLERQFHRR